MAGRLRCIRNCCLDSALLRENPIHGMYDSLANLIGFVCLLCSSSSTVGSICTMIAYGFLLLIGAKLLADGAELLLLVLDPGLIGGKPSCFRF